MVTKWFWRRPLTSCVTSSCFMKVPLRELVNYLTAASALQMAQVVEKCAQALSRYLRPTLAFLKLDSHSEEEDIQTPDGGWPHTNIIKQEERDADQPSTAWVQAASTGKREVVVNKSMLGVKVDSEGPWEFGEERKVFKAEIQTSEDTACCLKTLDTEKVKGFQPASNLSYKVHHITGALKCKLHPTTALTHLISSTTRESPASADGLVDSSQDQDEDEEQEQGGEEQQMMATPLSESDDSLSFSRSHMLKSRTDGHAAAVEADNPLVQRPYLCRRCDRVFQHLENYVGHLKEHKQYLCLVCGKSFSQRSNLTRHIRVHTGVKPFRCPLCHKTFSQKATLQDHLNLHTGDKPHKCNYCAVHFAHKPGLRRHLKDIHGKSTLENVLEEAAD
ncbi:zinc finger and BTB domain-containing protein 6-like isoform X2 [Sphaeramia orbicularis]|uniref:zinc finger and BTB domain-containing protein 6-like isoform X2 n=1 Tax=Sphaeramia orbicularis TaxID=375764 RepID=UPI00117CBE98|nr:zinc finger and BTB domain-containing protein 6-like isoform X2 [Sphaeramia orbicularis]